MTANTWLPCQHCGRPREVLPQRLQTHVCDPKDVEELRCKRARPRNALGRWLRKRRIRMWWRIADKHISKESHHRRMTGIHCREATKARAKAHALERTLEE